MDEYQAIYEDRFVQNLAHYSNLRQRIQRRVEQILEDPYERTERLGRVSGGLDLPAHFDGERIHLDEPFDLEPNTKLIVTIRDA